MYFTCFLNHYDSKGPRYHNINCSEKLLIILNSKRKKRCIVLKTRDSRGASGHVAPEIVGVPPGMSQPEIVGVPPGMSHQR